MKDWRKKSEDKRQHRYKTNGRRLKIENWRYDTEKRRLKIVDWRYETGDERLKIKT